MLCDLGATPVHLLIDLDMAAACPCVDNIRKVVVVGWWWLVGGGHLGAGEPAKSSKCKGPEGESNLLAQLMCHSLNSEPCLSNPAFSRCDVEVVDLDITCKHAYRSLR